MKLDTKTMVVLKFFVKINPSIILKPGNVIRTMSPHKTVVAKATVPNTFEVTAPIYNLQRFIANASNENCEVYFGENSVTFKNEKSKTHNWYASENMIAAPPDKDLSLPETLASFDMSWDDIQQILTIAKNQQTPDVLFVGQDGYVKIITTDVENPTSDFGEMQVCEYTGDDFKVHIKAETLNLIPMNYTFSLTNGVVHIKSAEIEYWIVTQR